MFDSAGSTFRVVGVVEDVRHGGPAADRNLETIYWPSRGFFWGTSSRVVVRAEGNPMTLVPAIRAHLKRIDPELPLSGIQTLRSVLDTNLEASRAQASLMGLLAGIALGLAVAGIYGVMAYSVSQRTREIGIRKALGGQDWQVVWEIVRRGLQLTVLGLSAGVLLTLVLGRVLASQVYGVSATDPLFIVLAGLAFGLVAILACLVPASRAARLDPAEVLRSE
jgi:ABC-type antimicrobial peptide transport system permease subunit